MYLNNNKLNSDSIYYDVRFPGQTYDFKDDALKDYAPLPFYEY